MIKVDIYEEGRFKGTLRVNDKCNVIEMTKGYVGKIKKQLKKWLV